MQPPVRVGVIGYGLMGERHARVYRELPNAALCAVADGSPAARDRASARLGVQTYAELEALLADPEIDAVSICLPDALHRAAVLSALANGKHVLVEKPLVTDPAEAREIVRAFEVGRSKLMVGFLLRFDPRYAAACEAARSGRLGEAVHVSSRRNSPVTGPRRYRGAASLPFHVATHEIDLVTWCLGEMPTRVSCVGVAKLLREYGVDDTIFATLEFPGGAIASLECSWALPERSPTAIDARLEVVGTTGQVSVETAHQGVVAVDTHGTAFPDTMRWTEVQGRAVGLLRDEIAHFVAAVQAGTDPVNDVFQAARVTRIAHALAESRRTGLPVTLAWP